MDGTGDDLATRFLSYGRSILQRLKPIGKVEPLAKFGPPEDRTSGTALDSTFSKSSVSILPFANRGLNQTTDRLVFNLVDSGI